MFFSLNANQNSLILYQLAMIDTTSKNNTADIKFVAGAINTCLVTNTPLAQHLESSIINTKATLYHAPPSTDTHRLWSRNQICLVHLDFFVSFEDSKFSSLRLISMGNNAELVSVSTEVE